MELHTRRPGAPRALADLARALTSESLGEEIAELRVSGISTHSLQVEPGDLFVAIAGNEMDGHRFVADAVARGAAAVVVEREIESDPGVPVFQVSNGRRVLAELAAAWYGHPGHDLLRVGITGTLGKTSTLLMLEAILGEVGRQVGSVGSLGVRSPQRDMEETGHTLPSPLVLHRAFDELRREGCEVVAMEATTHALTQERLHGVEFELGIFTNLVPLEHMDYHRTFRSYVEAKSRYFAHLRPDAPLIYFCDDLALHGLIERYPVRPVACGSDGRAAVRMEILEMDTRGTVLRFHSPEPLPRPQGGTAAPFDVRFRLPLLGRSHAANALLAAVAAISLGADSRAVESALGALTPVPRRMQIVHQDRFTILDDLSGHPNTVDVIFEAVEALSWRRLHVVTGYRGRRGVEINRGTGGALAIWARRCPIETLIVTRTEESSDAGDQVQPEEREAFLSELRREGVPFTEEARMDTAVLRALERVGEGDLLLLLGAQGMDGAAAVAKEWLGADRALAP